jgi:glutathione S-transferase
MSRLTLVGHLLCPYVQRVAIVLAEKRIPFERVTIDLSAKPAWFLAVSPLGKTPVLLVDQDPIFESAVICEYLDETYGSRLLPNRPLERARHRGWIELASAALAAVAAVYNAEDAEEFESKLQALRQKFEQLDAVLGTGPFFSGSRFSLVDAAWAPVFRYLDVMDRTTAGTLTDGLAAVARWRASLAARPSVRAAVRPDHAERLRSFLLARGGELSRLIADERAALPGGEAVEISGGAAAAWH